MMFGFEAPENKEEESSVVPLDTLESKESADLLIEKALETHITAIGSVFSSPKTNATETNATEPQSNRITNFFKKHKRPIAAGLLAVGGIATLAIGILSGSLPLILTGAVIGAIMFYAGLAEICGPKLRAYFNPPTPPVIPLPSSKS